MQTAILFTGRYRTFEKCHKIIKEQFIVPNQAKIFVYCEGGESVKDRIISLIGEEYIGDILCLPSTRTPEFKELCNFLTKTKPAIQKEVFQKVGWSQNYVFDSGSILEYYQFMKCYDMLLQYERENDMKFDILVRSRLDMITGEPLRLRDFFTVLDKDVRRKYGDDFYKYGMGNEVACEMLMLDEYEDCHLERDCVIPDLLDDLNHGDYLWVLGVNQIWIGKRHVFDRLYPLVFFYGTYVTENPFMFNSETQFAEHCKYKNITIFRHSTHAVDGHYICSKSAHQSLIIDGELNPERRKGLMYSIVRPDGYPFPLS